MAVAAVVFFVSLLNKADILTEGAVRLLSKYAWKLT